MSVVLSKCGTLVARQFCEPKVLAKVLRLKPEAMLREVGWDVGAAAIKKNKLKLITTAPLGAGAMPPGRYVSRSLAGCLVPFEVISALVSKHGGNRVTGLAVWDPEAELQKKGASAIAQTRSDVSRAIVAAVLGHVDHGKTTLLDKLLGVSVAISEPGLITQSVRPSSALTVVGRSVKVGRRTVVTRTRTLAFVDTPGHSVFSTMRAASVECADAVLVVVAVDAGVRAQTREALAWCAEAEVPVVFGISKVDTLGYSTLDKAASSREVATLARELCSMYQLRGAAPEVVVFCAPLDYGLVDLQEALCRASDAEGEHRLLEADDDDAISNAATSAQNPLAVLVVLELSRVPGARGALVLAAVRAGEVKAGDWVLCGGACGPVRTLNRMGPDAVYVQVEKACVGDVVLVSIAWLANATDRLQVTVGEHLCAVPEAFAKDHVDYTKLVHKFLGGYEGPVDAAAEGQRKGTKGQDSKGKEAQRRRGPIESDEEDEEDDEVYDAAELPATEANVPKQKKGRKQSTARPASLETPRECGKPEALWRSLGLGPGPVKPHGRS
mmetsp:Transcript_16127/g.57364  ORF Transcript_16127/g.57364 Transcript_16127/m.57364 type:complete len:555 (+) Transcript_16127:218-1882(+)